MLPKCVANVHRVCVCCSGDSRWHGTIRLNFQQEVPKSNARCSRGCAKLAHAHLTPAPSAKNFKSLCCRQHRRRRATKKEHKDLRPCRPLLWRIQLHQPLVGWAVDGRQLETQPEHGVALPRPHGNTDRTRVARIDLRCRRGRASEPLPRVPLPQGHHPGPPHVLQGVVDYGLLTQRHNPVPEMVHDAPLGGVDLVAGPQALTPVRGVVLGGFVAVLGELEGDDEGGQDDNLGAYRVDVSDEAGGGGDGVSLVDERRGQGQAHAPLARELGVQRVEDADGQGDGLEGKISAGDHGLDEGDRGGADGGRWWVQVNEVYCWSCICL